MQLDFVGCLSQHVSIVDPDLVVSGHFWASRTRNNILGSNLFLDKNGNLIFEGGKNASLITINNSVGSPTRPVFRLRIHWIEFIEFISWIPIRIQNRNRSFDDPSFKKITPAENFLNIFLIKNCNLFLNASTKERPSYRKSLHPSKENINLFSFCGSFLPSWIRIPTLLNPDPQHLKNVKNPVQWK